MLPLNTFVNSNFSHYLYIPLTLALKGGEKLQIVLGGGAIYSTYTKYYRGCFLGQMASNKNL